MTTKILPCKECGTQPILFHGYSMVGESSALVWHIGCDTCGAEAYHTIEGFARNAWNDLHGSNNQC